MKKNIGGRGKIIRGAVGITIISVGWYYQNWWGAIGVIPLVEAVFGWCAFQHFCGNKVCRKE